jgi:hypothetical protein
MKLTNEQLNKAIELHDSGITWSITAAYLNTTTNTLHKQLKANGYKTNIRNADETG